MEHVGGGHGEGSIYRAPGFALPAFAFDGTKKEDTKGRANN